MVVAVAVLVILMIVVQAGEEAGAAVVAEVVGVVIVVVIVVVVNSIGVAWFSSGNTSWDGGFTQSFFLLTKEVQMKSLLEINTSTPSPT